MLRLRFLLVLLLIGGSTLVSAQSVSIEVQADQVALEEIFKQLENENGFLFSYRPSDIQDVFVTGSFESDSISKLLKAILKPTNLDFEIVDEKYILIKPRINSSIPDKSKILCGTVFSKDSNENLFSASVYLNNKEKGSFTNEEGYFEFKSIVEKGDSLVVSYVGYETIKLPAEKFLSPNCTQINLNLFYFGESVIVTEYLSGGINLKENNAVVSLDPNQIAVLPGQTEPDIISTVKFLPGIISPDGSSSNISIRGGTSDQNLILWEDIPVYHFGHYFGMIPAFNPYIMNKVDVYRGGFDADKGGRISGLIDMKSDDKFNQLPNFVVGTNLLNFYTNGKAKLFNNKLNLIFSFRNSFTGLWRTPTFESIAKKINQGEVLQLSEIWKLPKGVRINDEFSFTDANFKASYQLSKRDELSVAWLYNKNDFESRVDDDNARRSQLDSLGLSNQGVKISWDHSWNKIFKTKALVYGADYNYDYSFEVRDDGPGDPKSNGLKSSGINERHFHLSNELKLAGHQFKFGYQLTSYETDFKITEFKKRNSQVEVGQKEDRQLHNAYTSIARENNHKLGYELGLRYNFVEDKNKTFWEPRLKVWYKLSNQLSLHLHYGTYYQLISQLVEIKGDNSSIETPIWTLIGDKENRVLNSNQYQFSRVWKKNNWLVDLQLYHKTVNGLTSIATGFDGMISGSFRQGESEINGLDLLLKKRWKNYSTWLSYSYSQVKYKFDDFFDPSFSADIEQPHVLNWINQFNFDNFKFSLGWKINSGTPYALIDNFRIDVNNNNNGPDETIVPIIREYNSERLPVVHQLDASLLYSLLPNTKRKFGAQIGLSVINLYNQRNLFKRNLFIKNESNQPPSLDYFNKADIGFTPNMVVRIEW